MANITFKGSPTSTSGELPPVGAQAPDFKLTGTDLSQKSLADFKGKNVVLNIFPSLDTGVCATSVRKFNEKASELDNTVILSISKDLPFAQGRFCANEGIDKVVALSEFKDSNFSDAYQVKIGGGPLEGLLSRAVVVIDPEGKVAYTQQVSEITDEPDYEKALEAIR